MIFDTAGATGDFDRSNWLSLHQLTQHPGRQLATTFQAAYVATAAGSPSRLIGVSTDPFGDDPNPGDNSANVSVTNQPNLTITTPDLPLRRTFHDLVYGQREHREHQRGGQGHGFKFRSDTSAGNRRFGLKVRVQATATPSDEGSWADLPNGSGGYMTRDATGLFVLHSLNAITRSNGGQRRSLFSREGFRDRTIPAASPTLSGISILRLLPRARRQSRSHSSSPPTDPDRKSSFMGSSPRR